MPLASTCRFVPSSDVHPLRRSAPRRILSVHNDRQVGKDNACATWSQLIPPQARRHPLAIFHGPWCLARYRPTSAAHRSRHRWPPRSRPT